MSQAGGPSEAVQQATREASNSSKQSSGNPMDLNSIPGSIGKGFGQTPGLDKPLGQGIGAQNLTELDPVWAKAVTGLDPKVFEKMQTVDNSAQINGQVGTIAPPVLQHSAGGLNKGQQGQQA